MTWERVKKTYGGFTAAIMVQCLSASAFTAKAFRSGMKSPCLILCVSLKVQNCLFGRSLMLWQREGRESLTHMVQHCGISLMLLFNNPIFCVFCIFRRVAALR